jgi:hypothetical protein
MCVCVCVLGVDFQWVASVIVGIFELCEVCVYVFFCKTGVAFERIFLSL